MSKKVINLTGNKGLTHKFGGDFIDSGYIGYDQEGQPNIRYNTKEGEMASGVFNPFKKYGFLSPSSVTLENIPQDINGSDNFTRESTTGLIDGVDKTLWHADKDALYYQGTFEPSVSNRYIWSSSSTEVRDMVIYYLNGVRTGFVAVKQGFGNSNIVKTFSLTSIGSKNESWSSSSVSGAFALPESYAISFLISGDGFMYILNKNAVHRVDGTSIGGTYGTMYKDLLKSPEDTYITQGVEYRNKMFLVIQKTTEFDFRGSTSSEVDKLINTEKGKIGIYLWNRQSTSFNSSDFIDLPGIAVVKNIWVSPSNKLYAMGLTSNGEVVILLYDGSRFINKFLLPSGADINKLKALNIYGNFTYWLGNDGYVYSLGSELGNDEDVITVLGKYTSKSWGGVNPVILLITPSTGLLTHNQNYAPDCFYVIGEFEDSEYSKKVFFPFLKGSIGYNESYSRYVNTNENNKGNIYTGNTLLPTLSNIQHINIFNASYPVSNFSGFAAIPNYNISFTAGRYNQGASFDGNFKLLSLPNSSLFKKTTPFSYSFNINTSTTREEAIYSNYSFVSTKRAGVYIYKTSTGKIQFLIGRKTGNVSGTDYKVIESISSINGSFKHITCQWTGTKMQIFIDGVLDVEDNWSYSPGYQELYNLHLLGRISNNKGFYNVGNLLTGIIDDFAYFSRALTQTEITELSSNVLTDTSLNNSSDILLYFPFDNDFNDYSKSDLQNQRESLVKIYINQSTEPIITKGITRKDINLGYISIEINRQYVNSIQLEFEYYNSNNINNNGRFTPSGVYDYCPFYAEVIYKETNTLK